RLSIKDHELGVDGDCRLVGVSVFAGGHRLAGQLLYLLPELVITQRQSAEGGLANVFNQRCRQLLAKQSAVCSLTLYGRIAQSEVQGVRCCKGECLAVGMSAITAPAILARR